MSPFFRVLSYSFYSDLDLWVSDRFINDLMVTLPLWRRLNSAPVMSGILCTGGCFVEPSATWQWRGRTVSLRSGSYTYRPIFLELGSTESTLTEALSQVSRTMLVDVIDSESGVILREKCCVADVKSGSRIEVIPENEMVERLFLRR